MRQTPGSDRSRCEDLGAGFTLGDARLWRFAAPANCSAKSRAARSRVAIALYMEMLQRAVNALKSGKIPQLDQPLHQGPEVDLHVASLSAGQLSAGRATCDWCCTSASRPRRATREFARAAGGDVSIASAC
jgi:hypothetical protein